MSIPSVNDSNTFSTRLLNRFYGIFLIVCATFLIVGVPFVFVKKAESAVLILATSVAVAVAWWISHQGKPQKSLVLFSIGLWVVLMLLLFGGLPQVTAAISLATSVMLVVVVSLRSGAIFVAAYFSGWLLYIVLGALGLAPKPFFYGGAQTGWFIGLVGVWLVLLPITEMIRMMRQVSSLQTAIIESTADGILVVNNDGLVVAYNQQFAKLWAIPADVLCSSLDKTLLLHAETMLAEPEQFLAKVHSLYEQPEQNSFDVLEFKDGRQLERYSQPHRLDHQIVGRVWSFRDVTVRLQFEKELQRSNSLMQGILEHIPVGLSAFDATLDLVASNRLFRVNLDLPDSLFEAAAPNYEQIIRYNAERGEYGQGDVEVVVQQTIDRARQYMPHTLERERPNGNVLEIRGEPLPGGGFVTTYTDITARKLSEQAALRNAMLLRAAIDAVDEAFALFDAYEQLVFCNDKYRELNSEFSRQEPQSLHAVQFNKLYRHSDGRQFRMQERRLADGHLVRFLIDISDLLSATQAAQDANVAKSQFLAAMSHEIRTPMNGILGMAQLLLTPELADSERLDYGRIILRSGQTLMSLLNDILDLSKIEAGKLELEDLSFKPGQVVDETKALFEGAVRNKNLELFGQWTGPPSQTFRGDPHLLQQMLSNLVGNAIKFTASGQIQIEAKVVINDRQMEELEFSVTDSGVGVSLEDQHRLFQAFSQADGSTTRRYGGTGLGLAIVQNFATMMGGSVGMSSSPGKGSRFWFRVPSHPALTDMPISTRFAEENPNLLHKTNGQLSGHVLVAEDNLVNWTVIQAMLAKLGLDQSLAKNGQEAVDAVKHASRPFDVVLMDLQMPVLDGYAATAEIRLWEREHGRARLPILALTADAFDKDRQHCFTVGMDDFLTKPIRIQILEQKLSQWIESPSQIETMDQSQELNFVSETRTPDISQIVDDLIHLLRDHKYDALAKLRELRDLTQGHAFDLELEEIGQLLNAFQFESAVERMTYFASVHVQRSTP